VTAPAQSRIVDDFTFVVAGLSRGTVRAQALAAFHPVRAVNGLPIRGPGSWAGCPG